MKLDLKNKFNVIDDFVTMKVSNAFDENYFPDPISADF